MGTRRTTDVLPRLVRHLHVELDRRELLRHFADVAQERQPAGCLRGLRRVRRWCAFLGDPRRYCGGKGGVGAHDSRTAGAACGATRRVLGGGQRCPSGSQSTTRFCANWGREFRNNRTLAKCALRFHTASTRCLSPAPPPALAKNVVVLIRPCHLVLSPAAAPCFTPPSGSGTSIGATTTVAMPSCRSSPISRAVAGTGQYPALHVRPAILDRHLCALAGLEVRHLRRGPKWQRPACGIVGVRVHTRAVRHLPAGEFIRVERRNAGAFASGQVRPDIPRLRRYRQQLRILLGSVCGGTFLGRRPTGGHADDTQQHDNRHKAV